MSERPSGRRWKIGAAAAGVIAAGGLFVMRGRRAPEPLPCAGDEACAAWGADALGREAAAARRWELSVLARPLGAALGRGDCRAAAELARGLRGVSIDAESEAGERMARAREAAVRGTLGHCGAGEGAPSFDVSKAVLRYSRGPCEGTCPVYTLTVRPDGGLLFESRYPRAVRREGRMEPERARALFTMLDRIGFLRMPARIPTDVTDVPAATLELEIDGDKHRVVDEAAGFGKVSLDAGLCWAEEQLGAIAQERGWASEARGEERGGPSPSESPSTATDGSTDHNQK